MLGELQNDLKDLATLNPEHVQQCVAVCRVLDSHQQRLIELELWPEGKDFLQQQAVRQGLCQHVALSYRTSFLPQHVCHRGLGTTCTDSSSQD